MEVHRTPAKVGGNATTTPVGPSPPDNRAPHGNSPAYSHQTLDSQETPNGPAGNNRSSIIHSHQNAYQPILSSLHTLASTAHSNTIDSGQSQGSGRQVTPSTIQPVPSATEVTSVDSVAVQAHSNADPCPLEQQKADKCATRATRGRPKKNPVPRQVELLQRLSHIYADRHAAMGIRTSGTSDQQAIDVEIYEQQREQQNANRLEEANRINEKFRQERARSIADSKARLVEVRRQAEDERDHYGN